RVISTILTSKRQYCATVQRPFKKKCRAIERASLCVYVDNFRASGCTVAQALSNTPENVAITRKSAVQPPVQRADLTLHGRCRVARLDRLGLHDGHDNGGTAVQCRRRYVSPCLPVEDPRLVRHYWLRKTNTPPLGLSAVV